MHKLDHIVVAATTLEEGTSYIENKLQVELSDIGYHDHMGTHNRVVKLGKSIYLEVLAIDPNSTTPKSKRWFNLDSTEIQLKLKISPRVIGYVIQNECKEILKYYEPFFRASRGEYKWDFSMPDTTGNILSDKFYQNGIMPSIINWKSKKPINKMQDNHLHLEKLQINLTENQLPCMNFINSLGDIEKLTFLTINQNNNLHTKACPQLKIFIKDKIRNTIIKL